MCLPQAIAALGPLFGGATAAGATAAAGTAAAAGATAAATATGIGSTLQMLGTAAAVGGSLVQGIAGARAASQQSAMISEQMGIEKQLNATEDNRRRAQFRAQIAQQRAELGARGVQLDSPTAVLLGQVAAQEMSFESQAVRSGGAARQHELTAQRRAVLAEGANSMLRGVVGAAGSLVIGAQEIWPGLSGNRKGAAA